MKCEAITKAGMQCKNNAKNNERFCGVHSLAKKNRKNSGGIIFHSHEINLSLIFLRHIAYTIDDRNNSGIVQLSILKTEERLAALFKFKNGGVEVQEYSINEISRIDSYSNSLENIFLKHITELEDS